MQKATELAETAWKEWRISKEWTFELVLKEIEIFEENFTFQLICFKIYFQLFLSSRLNNNEITTLEATGVFKNLSQLKKM